jgi:UDP-glucuronate decarboxylase
VCVDNLITGSISNIQEFMNLENFTFIESDIVDLQNVKCDFIYNLACIASPIWYSKYPIETIKTCTDGLFNIVDIAKENNASLFHASTSEVYGDPNESPQKETYYGNVNPYGPRSCYDEGKRCAEAILYNYKDELNLYIGRIFNTYGPRMQLNDGRVVTNFITQALKGEDITIYGDGNQTRSFSYVDDTVNGIIALMNSNYNEVFNIGNPNEITVNQLATEIIKLTNSNSKIINKNLPKDDPKQRQPDISKAKEKLDWKPEIELETGLKKTILWIDSELNH